MKRRKYKKNIVNKMTQTHKSLKVFWKLLSKLTEKESKTSSYVSHKTLTTHFQLLLNTADPATPVSNCAETAPLDNDITLEEPLESAKDSLLGGKGVGADDICNEMITCLIEVKYCLETV